MQDSFGDIGVADAGAFFAAVNRVRKGYIRTEADELQYNLLPEPEPEPEPIETAQPAPDPNAAAEEALRQALGETTAPAPAGPPLTQGEKDGLRVAVSKCWNVGSLSTDALGVTVVVAVNMTPDGKPDTGSIRMLSSSGGTNNAAETAFQAARRAIIRCGGRGFDLPVEKYDQWREIEMTFNPERMRIK